MLLNNLTNKKIVNYWFFLKFVTYKKYMNFPAKIFSLKFIFWIWILGVVTENFLTQTSWIIPRFKTALTFCNAIRNALQTSEQNKTSRTSSSPNKLQTRKNVYLQIFLTIPCVCIYISIYCMSARKKQH
jgi:hypothetical protein